MAPAEPAIETGVDSGAPSLRLTGDWTASHARRLETLASEASAGAVAPVVIDVAGVDRFDTFGAWAVERLRRAATAAGARVSIVGADAARAAMLAQLEATRLDVVRARRFDPAETLVAIGRLILGAFAYLAEAIALLGELVARIGSSVTAPRGFRWRSVVHHLDQAGVKAAPIIVLMTFLIGLIIAQQGLFYFRRFGASEYVVNFVAVLVLRELGVLLVSIMLAGRSGSAYAAEIGSMKMREEIDALRTMGLRPAGLLVLPRVLALVIAAPLLTMIGVLAALYGAGVVLWLSDGMAPAIFLSRLQAAATGSDFLVGMIKAPVMALVIGIIAAIEGFAVEGSAESLGARTTSAVVKSIFFVIVLDGFFAVFFTSIGL